MDITWLVVIVFILCLGLLTKWQNTRHIRKMRQAYLEQEAVRRANETMQNHNLPPYLFNTILAAERIMVAGPPQSFADAAKLSMRLADFGSRRKKS